MDLDSQEFETRTNAEQGETPADFRVSYESRRRVAELLDGKPFYIDRDTPCAPHLPLGSPERGELFRELGRTFSEDWAAAEEAWRAEQRETMGDLYFMLAGSAVKIGRSINAAKRLRHTQTHNHERVTLALQLKGQGWREKEFHKRFKQWQIHREWFERVPEIEAEIERLRNG